MEEKKARPPKNQEVLVVGAITESDLRYTPGGLAVLRLQVAGENAQEPKRPFYLTFRVFGERAALLADELRPGLGAILAGRFTTWRHEKSVEASLVADRVEAFDLPEEALSTPDAKGKRRLVGGMNRMWAVGNLARDVEVSYGPTGTPFTRGAVALQAQDGAHFLSFTAFRETALALEGAKKGERVFLEGTLLHDSWQTSDGNTRYGLKLEAERAYRLKRLIKAEPEEEEGAEKEDSLPF